MRMVELQFRGSQVITQMIVVDPLDSYSSGTAPLLQLFAADEIYRDWQVMHAFAAVTRSDDELVNGRLLLGVCGSGEGRNACQTGEIQQFL